MSSRTVACVLVVCAGCGEEVISEKLDVDHDGVPNDDDNCDKFNPTQLDSDANGIGDTCEQGIRFDFGSAEGWNIPDGKSDIAAYRPLTHTWIIYTSSEASINVDFGEDGDRPFVGDYDGDRVTDLGLMHVDGSSYQLRWRTVLDATTNTIVLPRDGQLVPADYDGDAVTDPAIFDSTTGTWTVRRSTDGAVQTEQLAAPGDLALPGDFDGDGQADFAVVRVVPGQENQGIVWSGLDRTRTERWAGDPGDLPLAVDEDGDGKTDIVTWRVPPATVFPAQAAFWSDGAQVQVFGVRGDCPLAFDYLRGPAAEKLTLRRPGIDDPPDGDKNGWYERSAGRPILLGDTNDTLIPIGAAEACTYPP